MSRSSPHVVVTEHGVKWAVVPFVARWLLRVAVSLAPMYLLSVFNPVTSDELSHVSVTSTGVWSLVPTFALVLGVLLAAVVGNAMALWRLAADMSSLHELSTDDLQRMVDLLQHDLPNVETILAAVREDIPLRYRDLSYVEDQYDTWKRDNALSAISR